MPTMPASREAGMNGHLAKPLDIPKLMEQMNYWLTGYGNGLQ